jgi:predicted RND superfamily exporter protein
VQTTGGAVALASLTTVIGYSSLLIASNQGFVSFGRLAVLGEVTCLSAALFVLPAFSLWNLQRKRRRLAVAEPQAQEQKRAA